LEFTEEEQIAIENTYRLFKGHYVHPGCAEDFNSGLMAYSLSTYAADTYIFDVQSYQDSTPNLQKAISSITKAYSVHKLPIYLYDLANYLEREGKFAEAKNTYMKFLDAQSSYSIDPIGKMFLAQRDLEKAIKVAQSKVSYPNLAALNTLERKIMQHDPNMERAVNHTDTSDREIGASDPAQELGFLWGKLYIIVILINVLFALSSLVLNVVDPTEYTSASNPISKTYFIAITLIGSLSGLGLLFRAKIGLYATLLVFSFFALLGLVVVMNMDIVGLVQGVVFLGIAFIGIRYFWRRRATFL